MSDLWQVYTTIAPQATEIWELLQNRGETIINDHVAFRTYDLNGIGLETVASTFTALGYQEKGHYQFPVKKLLARHYEHPDPTQPRIFISELKVDQLTPDSQAIIREVAYHPHNGELTLTCRHWKATYHNYLTLSRESEYAAWVYAHGIIPNHFTVSVNHLRTIHSLQELNAALKHEGYPLNTSGGEIKGTPEVFLEQSSTHSPTIRVAFTDGICDIPGAYVEFARRYSMPDGNLFSGFIAQSANKIFESTNHRS